MSQTSGVREVRAAGDSDGVAKADGGLMLPVVVRPVPILPGECIVAMFGFPHVGKVLKGAVRGAQMGVWESMYHLCRQMGKYVPLMSRRRRNSQ